MHRQSLTYLGNKTKLCKPIWELAHDINPEMSSFLDLFSGGGSVSQFFRRRRVIVHANDIAPYSRVINVANLEITKDFIDKQYPDFNEYLDKLNSLTVPSPQGIYFSKYYSENSEVAVQRLCYTKRNGLFIDAVLEELYKLEDEILRNIALSDLLYKMSVHANTSGTFKGYHKEFGGVKGDCTSRITAPITLERWNFTNDPQGKSFQLDAYELVTTTKDHYDVIYIDPPYNQHQYSANYHILESACLPLEERYIPTDDQVSGIDPSLYKSSYCYKKQCFNELSRLIEAACKITNHIILSYSESGHIGKDELVTMLEQHGPVELHEIGYTNYRGGRNRPSSKNEIKEYLITLNT